MDCKTCRTSTSKDPASRADGLSVVLISPYDLGRQPIAVAEAAALLEKAGFDPVCIDLSQQKLDIKLPADARVIFIHLGMLTATRIAIEALPRIHARAPDARIAVFGWYAPINDGLMRELGVDAVFGGESDEDMVRYARSVASGSDHPARHEALINLGRIDYAVPDRDRLPGLEHYARLVLPDGEERVMGFTDTTRGCKHLCRHCPVVPVYHGRFHAIPGDIVLADIDQQVEGGARHISFGDPDFLNGPSHALRIVRAMHARHPGLSWDAVIKIEHLLRHADLLPELRASGCILVTTAVESIDDATLRRLDKGHTAADFERVVALMRRAGIALAPTFIPFTPWTTAENFHALLEALIRLRLIRGVNPVQLSLRLLIPAGSRLLELPEQETCITSHDPAMLGYQWQHPDPGVDALQEAVRGHVEAAEAQGLDRLSIFNGVREIACRAAGVPFTAVGEDMLGDAVPVHSESWYCCAEPTDQQLTAF